MSPENIDRTAYLQLGSLAQRAVGTLVRLVKHHDTENVETDLQPALDLLVRVGATPTHESAAKYEELRTIRQVGTSGVDQEAMRDRLREIIELAKAHKISGVREQVDPVIFWLAEVQNQALRNFSAESEPVPRAVRELCKAR